MAYDAAMKFLFITDRYGRLLSNYFPFNSITHIITSLLLCPSFPLEASALVPLEGSDAIYPRYIRLL